MTEHPVRQSTAVLLVTPRSNPRRMNDEIGVFFPSQIILDERGQRARRFLGQLLQDGSADVRLRIGQELRERRGGPFAPAIFRKPRRLISRDQRIGIAERSAGGLHRSQSPGGQFLCSLLDVAPAR